MNLSTLGEISSQLSQARQLLLRPSPANLERCETLLAALAHQLQSWLDRIQASPPQQRTACKAAFSTLQSELACLQRLLDSAAEWFAGWSALRRLLETGYKPTGEPAPGPPQTHTIAEV